MWLCGHQGDVAPRATQILESSSVLAALLPQERENGVSVPRTGMIPTPGLAVGHCDTRRCLCILKPSPRGRERGQGRGWSWQLLPGTAISGLWEEPPRRPRCYPGFQRITADPQGCRAGLSPQALPALDLGSCVGGDSLPAPFVPAPGGFPARGSSHTAPKAPGAGSGQELGVLGCGSSSEPGPEPELHRALRAHPHVTERRRKSSWRKVGQRGRE